MGLHVSLSVREALDFAERGAWLRYQRRINAMSDFQLDNDNDEPAAWAELQHALAQIRQRRDRLPSKEAAASTTSEPA